MLTLEIQHICKYVNNFADLWKGYIQPFLRHMWPVQGSKIVMCRDRENQRRKRTGAGEKKANRLSESLAQMTQRLPPKATYSTRVAVNVNCLILKVMSAFNRSCLVMRDREPYSECFFVAWLKNVIATALNHYQFYS